MPLTSRGSLRAITLLALMTSWERSGIMWGTRPHVHSEQRMCLYASSLPCLSTVRGLSVLFL